MQRCARAVQPLLMVCARQRRSLSHHVPASSTPEYWNGRAASYESSLLGKLTNGIAERLFAAIELPPKTKVLDLGCGTGAATFVMLQKQPNINVVSLDFSPDMISQLEHRIASHKSRSRVRLITSDAAQIDDHLREDDFDMIVCNMSVCYYTDRARVLRGLYRCLKPTGKLLVTTWAQWHRNPLLSHVYDCLDEAIATASAPSACAVQQQQQQQPPQQQQLQPQQQHVGADAAASAAHSSGAAAAAAAGWDLVPAHAHDAAAMFALSDPGALRNELSTLGGFVRTFSAKLATEFESGNGLDEAELTTLILNSFETLVPAYAQPTLRSVVARRGRELLASHLLRAEATLCVSVKSDEEP